MVSQKLKLSAILFVITFVPYWNALNNSFLWDDEFLVEKNQFITSYSYIPEILTKSSTAGFGGQDNFYRPTQTLYYLVIHSIAGKSEIAFHLGNILLHAVNAILLFLLIARIFKNLPLAFLTSVLWLLHPTHTEAITYVSGTADPMSVLFVFLMLLSFPLEKKPKHLLFYFASLCFYILALMSKESVIIAPGLLLLIIFHKNKNIFSWKSYLPSLPFFIIALSYLILRETVFNFDETYKFYKQSNIYTENMIYRVYTFLAALTEYCKILLWPIDLHMERSFPVYVNFFTLRVLLGLSLILISGFAVYLFRSKKLWPLAWLWFFISFIPMMGIFIPVNAFILEHWLYLPSIGFFLGIAYLLLKLYRENSKKIFYTITTLLCLALTTLTSLRNNDWQDPIRFYSNILKYNKGTSRVHNNIAMAYSDNKNWDKAITHYLTSIEMSDTYPQPHYNLARVYIQKNDFPSAIKHLKRSLEINPSFIYSQKLLEEVQLYLKNKSKDSF